MPWAETDLLRLLPPGIALEKPFSFNDLLANVRHISTPAILAGPLSERQTPGDFARHQPPARTTAGQSDGRTGTPIPGFVRAS